MNKKTETPICPAWVHPKDKHVVEIFCMSCGEKHVHARPKNKHPIHKIPHCRYSRHKRPEGYYIQIMPGNMPDSIRHATENKRRENLAEERQARGR